jgi:hypothetical protein
MGFSKWANHLKFFNITQSPSDTLTSETKPQTSPSSFPANKKHNFRIFG